MDTLFLQCMDKKKTFSIIIIIIKCFVFHIYIGIGKDQ